MSTYICVSLDEYQSITNIRTKCTSVLPCVHTLPLQEMDDERAANGGNAEEDDVRQKIRIMKTVLEMGGQFSGINRKAGACHGC